MESLNDVVTLPVIGLQAHPQLPQHATVTGCLRIFLEDCMHIKRDPKSSSSNLPSI
jgi:hypothetical protein